MPWLDYANADSEHWPHVWGEDDEAPEPERLTPGGSRS